MTVRSPKTANHNGHTVWVVPITPEVRPILQDLSDGAEVGVESFVIRWKRGKWANRTRTFAVSCGKQAGF
jgi:hypothetical protein